MTINDDLRIKYLSSAEVIRDSYQRRLVAARQENPSKPKLAEEIATNGTIEQIETELSFVDLPSRVLRDLARFLLEGALNPSTDLIAAESRPTVRRHLADIIANAAIKSLNDRTAASAELILAATNRFFTGVQPVS